MSNLYRAQYAYPPVQGLKDETYAYAFNSVNVAALGTAIAAGAVSGDIYLQLNNDFEFSCRGVNVRLRAASSNLYLWIKDPFGNYHSQVPVPLSRAYRATGEQAIGHIPVVFEPAIECPAGGTFTVYLYNPTSGALTPPEFTFFGVNRCVVEAAA